MSWLKRNKWALLLLVPAITLAIAANSFRFWQIYLPWQADLTEQVDGPVVVTVEDTLIEHPPTDVPLTAELTPVSLLPIDSAQTDAMGRLVTASPGAQLWRLTVDVTASPELVLYGCTLSIMDADGIEYSPSPGLLMDGEPAPAMSSGLCFPQMQPGPGADLQGVYEPAPPDAERPPEYSVEVLFGVPAGVTPTLMRVSHGHGVDKIVEVPTP